MKENINGTEICYRIEGEGNNRVLLLHGWGCDMKLMQPVQGAAAARMGLRHETDAACRRRAQNRSPDACR